MSNKTKLGRATTIENKQDWGKRGWLQDALD